MRYLVLTASMGAGHDQVARELARRLEADGDTACVVDLLTILPAGLGHGLRRAYDSMLSHAPWMYEGIYQAFFSPGGQHDRPDGWRPGISPMTSLTAHRLAAVVDAERPHAVVSTFHLCGQAAGRLRASGRLTVPSLVFVTDFAAHRLWLHAGTDAFVCIHPDAAAAVRSATGKPVRVPGPVVAPAFTASADPAGRDRMRAELGLTPGQVAVLISGGSWGAGATEDVAATVAATGRYVPVVLCGHNAAQRARVAAMLAGLVDAGTAAGGIPLGWRDDVAGVMRACDVLVDNAAGLTALEAMASGLPVVAHQPIPGHGRDGVAAMAGAGLALFAETSLVAALDTVTTDTATRERLVGAGRSIFAGDAADDVRELAVGTAGLASRSPGAAFPAMIGREVHDLSATGTEPETDSIGGRRP